MSKPAACGLAAPAFVHACVIKNNSDTELTVQVEFIGFKDHHHELADVKIAAGEEQRIDEKEFEEGEGGAKYRKTLDIVRVKKPDGTTMELRAPFEGVRSPKKDWIFEISNNSINSIDPQK